QVEALTSEELLGQTNAFFNNAPTGKIFAERAKAVGDSPFKGPKFFAINDAMQQALTRVDVDKSDDAESSWAKFLTAVKSL
ncbi:MAG TPA: carbohydrate ABC transporter substrate-binding protein, partial [Arthrobacter sp.]